MRLRPEAALVLLVAGLFVSSLGLALPQPPGESGERIELRLKPLPPGVRSVSLEADASGRSVVVLELTDGGEERVSPDALASSVTSRW